MVTSSEPRTTSWMEAFRRCRQSDTFATFVVFSAFYFSMLQLNVLNPILPGMTAEIYYNHGLRFGPINQSIVNVTFPEKRLLVGLILTAGSAAEMVSMPLGVKICEWLGSQRMMYLSSLLEVSGCTLLGLSLNLPMAFIGRAVQCVGVTFLDISGNSLLANRFDRQTLPRALSTAFHGMPLGLVTSSIAGTIAYEYLGYTITLLAVGVFGCLEALLRFTMTDKPKEYFELDSSTDKELTYKEIFRHANPVLCLYFTFFMFFSSFVINTTAPDDIVTRLGGHFWQVGVIFAIGTVVQLLSQFVIGEVGIKLGLRNFLFIGHICIGIGLCIYVYLPSTWYVTVLYVIHRIGYGFTVPSTCILLADFVSSQGSSSYERVYGLHTLMKVMGITLGSLFGGYFYSQFSIGVTYWIIGGIAFISAFLTRFM